MAHPRRSKDRPLSEADPDAFRRILVEILERVDTTVTVWRRQETPTGPTYALEWANRSEVDIGAAGLFGIVDRLTATQLDALDQAARRGREVSLGVVAGDDGRRFALRGTVIEGLTVLLAEDVTEDDQTRAALRRTASELADLYDRAPVGHHSIDKHGTFVRINDTELSWLGYTREELIGRKRFPDLLTPDSRRIFEYHFPEFMRDGGLRDVEFDIVCKDGTILPVQISSTAVLDAEGRYVKSRSTVIDIRKRRAAEAALMEALQQIEQQAEEGTAELRATSQRLRDGIAERDRARADLARAEDQFRQAQKMEAIGCLAGGIAHDFNNMLQVVLGFTQLVQDELPQDDVRREDLAQAVAAATRAAMLTRQLLTFSRQHVTQLEPLDLNAMLSNLETMLRRLIGPEVQLVTRYSDAAPVCGDRGHLEQLVFNLAANARDAMPNGGTLTIETMSVDLDRSYTDLRYDVAPGRYVLIAVSDTGVGMSKEVQERVFEPFFTTKEVGKGTGLGLSMVYGVVRQLGGHLGCYSEEGRGTTMKVYLPEFARTAGATAPDLSRAPQPSRVPLRGRVLLVEDEELVRAALAMFLRRMGLAVVAPSSGTEAFSLATAEPFDLIVTDVVMPDTSGPDLVRSILACAPGTPVLFVSGYADLASVRHGVPPGAAFLQKPVDPATLELKVRELLSPREM